MASTLLENYSRYHNPGAILSADILRLILSSYGYNVAQHHSRGREMSEPDEEIRNLEFILIL